MARVISSLPATLEAVAEMPFSTMVDTALDLANPDTQICGEAGMQLNAFLAHAAVRMAKHIREGIQIASLS